MGPRYTQSYIARLAGFGVGQQLAAVIAENTEDADQVKPQCDLRAQAFLYGIRGKPRSRFCLKAGVRDLCFPKPATAVANIDLERVRARMTLHPVYAYPIRAHL